MKRTIALELCLIGFLALAPAVGVAQVEVDGVTDQGMTDQKQHPLVAQTELAAGGSRSTLNTDFTPAIPPIEYQNTYNIFKRVGLIAGILNTFPPNVHPSHEIAFTASSRGAGFRHVHAFDPETGEVFWQTRPWLGDFDRGTPGPINGTGILDKDGNLYQHDTDDLFSYDVDGNLRWQRSFDDGRGDWLSYPVMTNGGNIAFFHKKSGLLAAYDTDTGETVWEFDGLTEIDQQGSCPQALLPLTFLARLYNSLWPQFALELFCGGFGFGQRITESQALDPTNNAILYMGSGFADPGGGETPGAVYSIQVLTDEDGNETGAEFKWITEMAPGTGTSPTINLEDNTVLGADGDGVLQAHDLDTGELRWETDTPVEVIFSPPVSKESLVLSTGSAREVIAFDGESGDEVWRESYEFLVPQAIGPGPPMPPFTDGTPDYEIISGVSPQMGEPAHIVTNPIFGYPFNEAPEPLIELAPPFHPLIQGSIQLSEKDGKYIPDSLTLWTHAQKGHTQDVGLVFTSEGWGMSPVIDLVSGNYIANYNWRAYLPFYRNPLVANGGLHGFEPSNYFDFTARHLEQASAQGERGKEAIAEDDLQNAYNQIRWMRRILEDGTPRVIEELVERDGTSCPDEILAEVADAEEAYENGKNALFGFPDEGDKADAVAFVTDGQESLANALEILLSDECEVDPPPGGKVVICHKGQWTRVVPPEEFDPEFDTLGPCEGDTPPVGTNVLVCFKGKTKNLPPETAEKLLDAGGTLGPCE